MKIMANMVHGTGMILEQCHLQKWKCNLRHKLPPVNVTNTLFFLVHFSTPDPDNVLIVKTPDGVFSTKFLLQNNEKQSPARLAKSENHQEVFPAEVSDCLAARCLPYEMLKNKVFSNYLGFLHPPWTPPPYRYTYHCIATRFKKRQCRLCSCINL